MSNSNNSKRVKLSSVETGIKSEDEDEAFPVEQKQPIAGCSQSAKPKTPKDASETVTAIATSDTAKGSDLVEDVLMLIFAADFLDTEDLLHFRLVNRSWRDSATSVLLRSSACQISFNLLSVPIPSTVKIDATKGVYCNNNNYNALLDDLNEIISQSPKFPCSNFRFVNSNSLGDAYNKDKIDTLSLHKFFSVYGNNVKTITLGDLVCKKDLRSLLLNYAPCLECLDLQYLKSFRHRGPSRFQQPLFPKSSILPNLKTLVLGQCPDFNLIELVDAAINLESVENTRVADLKLLLDHGKVGLIKKLEFGLYVQDLEESSVFKKLAEGQPKLTKLIITAGRLDGVRRDNEVLRNLFRKMQKFLSRILESSKDTLKYLDFRVSPFADIKFPILKQLECLKLIGRVRACWMTTPCSPPMYLEFALGDEHKQFAGSRRHQDFELLDKVDTSIYGLCPNRPCDRFPNLQKLQLGIHNYNFERDGTVILLHTCQSRNRKIVMRHFYKTVKVIEFVHTTIVPITIPEAQDFSNLFRNVTILKIKCTEVKGCHSALWVLAPLSKSIEIYGLCNNSRDESGRPGRNAIDEVGLVDSFFTGFSIEMCTKLRGTKQFPMEIEGNPSLIKFMRVKPSICDLYDLRDFKILFTELRSTFASRVSGFYAFRNMPRTSITFAHAAPIKFNEAECEMKKYLAPVLTFIHFTHRNLPERFGDDIEKDL